MNYFNEFLSMFRRISSIKIIVLFVIFWKILPFDSYGFIVCKNEFGSFVNISSVQSEFVKKDTIYRITKDYDLRMVVLLFRKDVSWIFKEALLEMEPL